MTKDWLDINENIAMTATLLIQTQPTPFTVSLPAIAPMTRDRFYAFCRANPDLRIEQTASGEVVIMPPAFSDTGNRNFNLAAHLWIWTEKEGTGLGFYSSAGFTLPNGAMPSQRKKKPLLRPFARILSLSCVLQATP